MQIIHFLTFDFFSPFLSLGHELQEVRSSEDEMNTTMNLKEVKHESTIKGRNSKIISLF